ncbi:ABC-three component system protein [Chitinophaga sp. GbtcB8]|uniref:ABC-three component system protein n=1 Tax=Chitinophaga sp. GbtcB8 TaxID=2824753 RepID=UPI001C30F5AA|nr:ABC-three component system protein [Chitinophaga sp. GbtcB8]
MPTIEEQLRFFAVKVNEGSGCLFQPDSNEYTYVLTVKHNLEVTNGAGEKILKPLADIKIYRNNADGEPISDIIACEPHETLDIALIVIPYIGDSEMILTHSLPAKDESLFLYGYPSRLKDDKNDKRENVRCFCDMQREHQLSTEIRTEQGQHTWDINTQNAMVGFSGCGVFTDINGVIVLKGIFPELKDPTGANNKLIMFYISNFDSIADKLNRKHLIPSNLLSFKSYSNKAFKRVNPGLKHLFSNNIEQVTNGTISPIAIAERNKNSLTLPVSINYLDNLSQSKLWEAWLELLTVLNIAVPENEDLEFCCSKVPLYFSANENHIQRLIKLFLSDNTLRSQIKKDSLIAFSSTEASGGREFLNKEEIRKIVAILNQPDFFNDKMMIGNATQVPGFSCVHIDHFSTKIDQLNVDELRSEEILELIKQEIKNILNYAS